MAKRFTMVLGLILLVVGVAGMATGGGPHDLMFFGVNAGHNLVHVVSGVLALIAGLSGQRAAVMFCLAFGVIYGAVAVLGFFGVAAVMSLLHLNLADDVLHLAIAAACLWVGGTSK